MSVVAATLSTVDRGTRRINVEDRWKTVGDFDGHTHGRTGAALFVPAPPRLGGASNLLENQINLAAGRRTLSPSFSRLIPLPFLSLCVSLTLSPSLSSLPFSLSLSHHPLSVSRGHEQIEGTGPREAKAKKEVGRRSSVPPTRTQRREEKVAQQQRALDFWLRPSQGRTYHVAERRNVQRLETERIERNVAICDWEGERYKKYLIRYPRQLDTILIANVASCEICLEKVRSISTKRENNAWNRNWTGM